MNEATFNNEIKNSLKAVGRVWRHKLADSPASWTQKTRVRFTPEKPCDIIAGIRGYCVLIEGKQMRKWESFGMKDMRESQIENLDEAVKCENQSYVFLNVRIKSYVTKRGVRVPYENRLIIFEWRTFKGLWERETIKTKDLKELPYIKGSDGFFDLKEFVEYVEQNH